MLFITKTSIIAQNDSITTNKLSVNLTGCFDGYYLYDHNKPKLKTRQYFFYNHNRHKSLDVNLMLLKLSAENNNFRFNVGLQTGNYVVDNYLNESGWVRNFSEVNFGFSLVNSKKVWFDAGIFPSHIGFESAIGFDNATLTRSILAESSPYYNTGIRFTYYPSQKWKLMTMITNGWQRIQWIKGNSLPSLGTQLVYNPTQKSSYNWSTFLGTDDRDVERRMRYFNNFYGQFYLGNSYFLTAGFDIGFQQSAKKSESYYTWLAPVLILQYTINDRLKTSCRAEYYFDEKGVIIPTSTYNGFNTIGFSANIDYFPKSNMAFRFESRYLKSEDAVFENQDGFSKNNFFITTSFVYKWNHKLTK